MTRSPVASACAACECDAANTQKITKATIMVANSFRTERKKRLVAIRFDFLLFRFLFCGLEGEWGADRQAMWRPQHNTMHAM